MIDVAGDLTNAVVAHAGNVAIAGTLSDEARALATKWFGELRNVPLGTEEIYAFETDLPHERIVESTAREALAALKRDKHVFQFRPVERDFVRRNQAWLEQPGRF